MEVCNKLSLLLDKILILRFLLNDNYLSELYFGYFILVYIVVRRPWILTILTSNHSNNNNNRGNNP